MPWVWLSEVVGELGRPVCCSSWSCYGSTEHPTVSSARFDDPLAKRQFTDGKGGT